MTNEEMELAIKRLNGDLLYARDAQLAVTRTPDLRAILSERAKLLATVERMQGLLKKTTDVLSCLNKSTDWPSNYVSHLVLDARAALTTGEV